MCYLLKIIPISWPDLIVRIIDNPFTFTFYWQMRSRNLLFLTHPFSCTVAHYELIINNKFVNVYWFVECGDFNSPGALWRSWLRTAESTPFAERSISSKKPWLNKELLNMCHQKKTPWQRFKRSKSRKDCEYNRILPIILREFYNSKGLLMRTI